MLSALQAGAFHEGWPAVPSNAALECLTALTELQLTVQFFHIENSNPHDHPARQANLSCFSSFRGCAQSTCRNGESFFFSAAFL